MVVMASTAQATPVTFASTLYQTESAFLVNGIHMVVDANSPPLPVSSGVDFQLPTGTAAAASAFANTAALATFAQVVSFSGVSEASARSRFVGTFNATTPFLLHLDFTNSSSLAGLGTAFSNLFVLLTEVSSPAITTAFFDEVYTAGGVLDLVITPPEPGMVTLNLLLVSGADEITAGPLVSNSASLTFAVDVPLPGTGFLMGIALVGMMFVRRNVGGLRANDDRRHSTASRWD
jgi:hypothetical protein